MKYKIQAKYSKNSDFIDYPYFTCDSKKEAEQIVEKLTINCEEGENGFKFTSIDSEEEEMLAVELMKWYNKLS